VIFLDTNILVYSLVPNSQNLTFHKASFPIFAEYYESRSILVSDLSLLEFCYGAFRSKVSDPEIINLFDELYPFCKNAESTIILRAFDLMQKSKYWRNSNDCFHLAFAEHYQCDALMTFDKDFVQLVPYSKIPIKILQV
jgi:predicted nucleic acid-binding protein